MSDRPIPIARPRIPVEAEQAVLEVLRSGWLTGGPAVRGLEADWSAAHGGLPCVSVTSATTGLFAALRQIVDACAMGRDGVAVVPAFTWCATANAAHEAGLLIRFCDVDLDTYNADVDDMATRLDQAGPWAIAVPVHLFGRAFDVAALRANIGPDAEFLEDAACGFGATHADGSQLGTQGGSWGAVFSLHPRKAVTCGEGGMVQGRIAMDVRSYSDHGCIGPPRSSDPWEFAHYGEPGLNFRLPDILAAVVRPQLARRDDIVRRRTEIARGYSERLAHLERHGLKTPEIVPGHGWQVYVCRVDAGGDVRNRIMTDLRLAGIATRPGTHAVHVLAHFGHAPSDFPNAWRLQETTLALPIYPELTDLDLDRVADAVARSLGA